MPEPRTLPPGEPAPAGARGLSVLLPLLAAYLGTHLLVRLALSPSLSPDEADVALFSQSLAWGYSEQPPLYSWIVWGFVRVLGLSVFTLTLVKLLTLAAVHLFAYTVARRLVRDERLALLAVLSLFLLPTFAWNSVNYLTHTLLLCAVSLATVHRVLMLPEFRTWGSYALLGLYAGLGVLSKYNYVVFAAALLIAMLLSRPYRRCLLDRRVLVAVAVAGAVVLPHLLWAMAHRETIWSALGLKTGIGRSGGEAGVARGLANLYLSNVLLLTLPFLGGLTFVLRPRLRELHRAVASNPDGVRLLERFFLAALALLTLQVFVAGTTRFHERWLQPFLLLVPVYGFARLEGVRLEPRRVRRYAAVLAALALGVTAGQAAKVWVGSRDDGVYPLQMAFGGAAECLAAEGFGGAVLVASDRVVGGNLCLCFPGARVYCAWHPAYRLREPVGERPCFALWHLNQGTTCPKALQGYSARALDRPLVPAGPVRVVTVPAIHTGRRTNQFGYVRLVPAPSLSAISPGR